GRALARRPRGGTTSSPPLHSPLPATHTPFTSHPHASCVRHEASNPSEEEIMMSLRKTVLSATIALMLGPAGFAWAAGPTETVQTAIQRVFTESSAPQVRAGSTDDRRAHIREAAESLFDFREMARRSLGERFDALSAADQKEFVRLFTNLIASSYLGKIEAYAGEPIRY